MLIERQATAIETREHRISQQSLFALAVLAAAGLVYASILPVQYQTMPLADAWQKFVDIPWLNLGLGRRADWVANGLAIVPFGFLAAGACDTRGKSDTTFLCCLVAIMATGSLLTVGIEFLQVWFPIRTLSLNDIAAGITGAIVGPVLWLLVGRPLRRKTPRLHSSSIPTKNAVQLTSWLLAVYCFCLALYSMLPLDIMFRHEEWQAKAVANRFEWAPYSVTFDITDTKSIARTFFEILKSGITMIPAGAMAALALSKRHCILLILVFPALLEALQAPVFTRHTVYSDVLSGWMGGLVGVQLVATRHLLARLNQNFAVRLALVAGITAAILALFLGGATEIRAASELAKTWENFIAPPFAKYYFMDEFNAFSNALKKAIAFVVLGASLSNLLTKSKMEQGRVAETLRVAFAFTFVVLVSCGIEISQVYLKPFVGDASDILLYVSAACLGWVVHRRATRHVFFESNDPDALCTENLVQS